MKVPWDETPEVYDTTPPWEKKEMIHEIHSHLSSLARQELDQLGSGCTFVGYKAGPVDPNQNVCIGYQAGPSAFVKMVKTVRDSDWFNEQTGKIAQACPQCGQILYEMNKCYICHICGTIYAIEED